MTLKNNFSKQLIVFFSVTAFFIHHSSTLAGEWSGNISAEIKAFKHKPLQESQYQYYSSLAFEPKYQATWDNGQQIFDFEIFSRLNAQDSDRNSVDIRELSWIYAQEKWEFRFGIRKVFWGVTESQHLVDIINQSDFAERFDSEAKLGQPMINFAWIKNWGTTDFFILPYFRERKFPSDEARLNFPLSVATDSVQYEASGEEKHIDTAIRWSHYIGDWDMGLSHFYGTSREPRFRPQLIDGTQQLVPIYDLINQTGIDIQATLENWLWKFEGIYRSGMDKDFFATVAGLEYSFFDIAASGTDIGIVVEYLYNDKENASTTPFQNDTMVGIRLAFNDEQSTDALIGAIIDNDGNGIILSLEANRRIASNWKISIDASLFTQTNNKDAIDIYAREDYIQVELGYYY
ncbi:FIG01201466: hypothetical protein [hydrothermal vent metagenome]|uniref:Uncharacterized protein n=1 Tax=hydrothermal vent metagenome TaxID=652676 RepID=A0A3B0ZAJ8_9ZZZZ